MWQLPSFDRIGPEQFSDLFKSTPVATLGQLINATIIALALYPVTSISVMAGWWTVNMAMCTLMWWRWYKNRHRVITKISSEAIPRAMMSGFLYALPWSILVVLYLGEIPHREELLLGIAVIGMAAAGSVQLARIYPAALVYLATILFPVVLKSIILAELQYYLLAGLSISYIVYLISIISSSATTSIERSAALSDLEVKVNQLDLANDALEKLAKVDDLTGLPNRRAFHDHLTSSISEAAHLGSKFYLLLCDLDHFKNVNDTAGHTAGDYLLQKIADRLQKNIEDCDFVARLGGDEFAIIVKSQQNNSDAREFIQTLMNQINRKVKFDNNSINIGISIGVSNFPRDAQLPEVLLSLADITLQRGKSISRGQLWFFNHKLRSKLSSDAKLEADLRIALTEKQFELFYQPKVDIRTGQLRGFESLLRWRRMNGEIESPGAFLPVASERGLVLRISDFVVDKVIEDICMWQDMDLDAGEISINIHPLQIKDHRRMKRLVQDFSEVAISPEKIILEITEECVIGRGTDEVPDVLRLLLEHDFKVSLDDFGTGYASLTHLKTLPVSEIKLDRSFINDLGSSLSARSIVHSMIKLVDLLGLTTVAEGIENQEQHNILLAMGCATGQGYFYGRPMNLETATKYLRNAAKFNSNDSKKFPKLVDIAPQDSPPDIKQTGQRIDRI